MHLIRDIIVAVVGGLIALVIGLVVTNASRTQQVWVYVGAIGVCGLVLGSLQLPGLIKRRREAFKLEIIAAVRDQILADLASGSRELRQGSSVDITPAGTQTSTPVDASAKLSALLEEGRVLQGSLRFSDVANTTFYGDEAVEIGRWEGRARAALVRDEDSLFNFENAPGGNGIGISRGDVYRRMDAQLSALEAAIRRIVNGSRP